MEPPGPAFGRPDDKLRAIRDHPRGHNRTAAPGLRDRETAAPPSGLRDHNPKTNSMVWLRMLAQFGRQHVAVLVIALMPDRMATYCLPPASKVIGGALKPVPTLIFHT